MTNPATTADVESRWRTLSTSEIITAATFLDDAWGILKRRVTGLEANILTDAALKAEVVRIVATAVIRVMKNPDGKRQESIDDYSWTRDQTISAGLLYFTDEEIADLIPGGDLRTGAFSFSLLPVGYPESRFP